MTGACQALERARDEVVLGWLALREQGVSENKIAARYGVPRSTVSMTLTRIDRDSQA